MTLIRSHEELEALPPGAEIRVRGQGIGVWQRTENGFAANGAVVGTRFFVAFVDAGAVTRNEPDRPSQPGDWWTYSNRRYVVLHLFTDADGLVHVGQWMSRRWRGVTTVERDWFRLHAADRLSGPPEGLVTDATALGQVVDGLISQPPPPEPPRVAEFRVIITGSSTVPPKVEVVPMD